MFEKIDKPALKPLPAASYEYAQWKKARVNIDYHIEFDRHYYSVPYQLRKEQVDIRFTDTTVEVLFKNKRVASYYRSYKKGGFITCPEHMPKSHQKYLEWTPSRIIKWAGKNGPKTAQLVMAIMNSRRHPEQGFRACLVSCVLANDIRMSALRRHVNGQSLSDHIRIRVWNPY